MSNDIEEKEKSNNSNMIQIFLESLAVTSKFHCPNKGLAQASKNF